MDHPQPGPWRRELHDFVRAFSGAFLFGTPLLFTMEMWEIGLYADHWQLYAFLALAFAVNLGLNYFAGFKQPAHTFGKALNQAIDAVAVGIVAGAVVLLVLDRINPSEPLDGILGQITIQAVPLSIGASTANAVLGGGGRGGQDNTGEEGAPRGRAGDNTWLATLNDLGATIGGGIFIGFSVATTEEIPLLAGELDYAHKLGLIALSLVVTYGIVFASGFDPQHAGKRVAGVFQRPLTETAMSYLVSLLVALVALILFDQVGRQDPLTSVVAQTIVLGFVTAIGGAAGRVVV